MPGTKKKLSISHDTLNSAKLMEAFCQIKRESIFSAEKKKELENALIFSCKKRFGHWEDGKECKIFRSGPIIYYCTTWEDYAAFDVLSGKTIGRAVLENDWLQTIDVDVNFRRKGIGTNLIKAIVKTIGNKFNIPTKGVPNQSTYFLTEEGAALINACRRKKIITDDQCMLDVPPCTPKRSPGSPGPL